MDKKSVIALFNIHSKASEFYITSDSQGFKTENEANGHAGNLRRKSKDASVTKVTREQAEAWAKEGGSPVVEAAKEPVKPELSAEDKKALGQAKGKVTRLQKLYDTAIAGGDPGDAAKIMLDGAIAELQAMPGYVAEPGTSEGGE